MCNPQLYPRGFHENNPVSVRKSSQDCPKLSPLKLVVLTSPAVPWQVGVLWDSQQKPMVPLNQWHSLDAFWGNFHSLNQNPCRNSSSFGKSSRFIQTFWTTPWFLLVNHELLTVFFMRPPGLLLWLACNFGDLARFSWQGSVFLFFLRGFPNKNG